MKIRLSTIDLSVSDITRSLEFYAKILELPISRESAPPSTMILEAEGCAISLHQTGTEGGRPVHPGSTELAFETDDLEGLRERLRVFGVEVGEVQTFGYGRAFEARDPDGYLLNVYEPRC